jgi:lipoate-protein ligase A
MIEFFRDQHGLNPGTLRPEEIAEAETLVRDRFGTREWVYFLP